ncbi:MAG: DUF1566 domain-containing protein [Rectinemataceae bacterium]
MTLTSSSRPLSFFFPVLLLLFSCQPFGSYDNPGDPKASNYQGFETVATVADLSLVYPKAGGTFEGVKVTLTQVLGASSYRIALAASQAALASASAQVSATNTFDISAAKLADKTTYWIQASAKGSDGNWGSWIEPVMFTTAYSPAATPSFSPAGGDYTSTQSVTISSTTVGATIWYTSDGSDPSSSVTRLSGPSPVTSISVPLGTTLRAEATATGYSASAEGTAVYSKLYKVGDTGPAGGIVFYDKGSVTDGWRYLEAAPSDQSTGIQWYNGNFISVTTGTAVGTGKANTAAIIAVQGSGSYAASLCKNLSLGGYSDWFLPSKDELNLMYTNLKKAGLGGFSGAWLWSSSQNGSGNGAWGQRFSDGVQGYSTKHNDGSVRACRAFIK